jgi:hypothetical protein
MLFMVVERFTPAGASAIYRRCATAGDLADFEIVPVTPSRSTQEPMARLG